jgi:hypothetical protein
MTMNTNVQNFKNPLNKKAIFADSPFAQHTLIQVSKYTKKKPTNLAG